MIGGRRGWGIGRSVGVVRTWGWMITGRSWMVGRCRCRVKNRCKGLCSGVRSQTEQNLNETRRISKSSWFRISLSHRDLKHNRAWVLLRVPEGREAGGELKLVALRYGVDIVTADTTHLDASKRTGGS